MWKGCFGSRVSEVQILSPRPPRILPIFDHPGLILYVLKGAQIEESPCHLVLKPMTRKEICFAEPNETYFLIRELLWNQRPPFYSLSPLKILYGLDLKIFSISIGD
jgi:hypothetical protein